MHQQSQMDKDRTWYGGLEKLEKASEMDRQLRQACGTFQKVGNDLEAFFCEVQKFCLNGMNEPFWWDWLLAELSWFFTPELLHHIHKEFWDHDVQWIILAVEKSEIDFRFSIIQPTAGYQHFHTAALDEFHANKHTIIAAGVCQGKGGKWSADVTEHEHITEVNDPTRSSNNNNYDPQICHYLDHADKCNQFDLTTSLLDHSEDSGVVGEEFAEDDDEIDYYMNVIPTELPSPT
ncbi:hypothetical protein BDR06DRAFT_970252 [Suillus hirtellus]|nr:hypothetical protein BDR06DRAFT_970252 [Suillus hirtellus]